jgi:DNA (cytosine-5)-methyltransferase 1
MTRPLLLDMYCGAGGAAMGYFLAGFDVIGIDIKPQPEYPFKFIQANILQKQINWKKFDAVHASPPCQTHSVTAAINGTKHHHPNLIPYTRYLMQESQLPFIIENVPGAPLRDPFTLCGSMFGLNTQKYELKRHRLFESNIDVPIKSLHKCGRKRAVSVMGHGGIVRDNGKDVSPGFALCMQLMGMPWVRRYEALAQAIPPAYTAWIGYHLRKAL